MKNNSASQKGKNNFNKNMLRIKFNYKQFEIINNLI